MTQTTNDEIKAAKAEPEHRQLIATAKRDISWPVMNGVWRVMDDTLLTRGGALGLKLYDDIERDCHVSSVIQKRKMAVIAREWIVKPASEDPRDQTAADFVREALDGMPFDRLCLDLMDAVLKGFAVSELIWDFRDGHFLPGKAIAVNQRRITFDEDKKPRLLTLANMLQGEEVPERKFIVHRFGGKDGHPHGLGLGSKLYWPTLFKRQGIAFWLVFAEKFASPTAVAKYESGMNEQMQDKLLASIMSIAQQSGVIVPKGTEVELLEATRGGAATTYRELCAFMDAQISEAVLGETLTTNIGDTGSRAASETHNEVREELTDADCDLLSATLKETLVQWLIDFNMPGAGLPEVLRPRPENEIEQQTKLKAKTDWLKDMKEIGYRPTQEWMLTHFGEGFEPILEPAVVAPVPAVSSPAFAEDGPDLPDQLAEAVAPVLNNWLDEIKAIVDGAPAPDEVGPALIEAFAHRMDAATLTETLGYALALAELQGMAEVNDDASR